MSEEWDPNLSFGQRIMNHKFAKMSIWEFLGWRPKEPKMTWLEAEEEIWKNRLRLERQMAEREVNRVRTSYEWDLVNRYAKACRDIMFKFQNEFELYGCIEDWKEWVLAEMISSYLPLSYKKVIDGMKADGKYIPISHIFII